MLSWNLWVRPNTCHNTCHNTCVRAARVHLTYAEPRSYWNKTHIMLSQYLALTLLVPYLSISPVATASDVVKLSDGSFAQEVLGKGRDKPWMVIFCSRNIRKCVKLDQMWGEAASILGEKTKVGFIDTYEYKTTAFQFRKDQDPFVIYVTGSKYAVLRNKQALKNHVGLVNWALSKAKESKFYDLPEPPNFLLLWSIAFLGEMEICDQLIREHPAATFYIACFGACIGFILGALTSIPTAPKSKPKIVKSKKSD
ncbi:hypothetical protein AAMO2058_001410700 [Amorphochlora amoebiformis]